jgi:hypothetical protein
LITNVFAAHTEQYYQLPNPTLAQKPEHKTLDAKS